MRALIYKGETCYFCRENRKRDLDANPEEFVPRE